MEVIIQPKAPEGSLLAAKIIRTLIRSKPSAVLGLATGGTPQPVYAELVRMHAQEGLDFSYVRTFNLDEYIGLSPEHPCSYRHFMVENLFHKVNIPEGHTHFLDGLTKDVPDCCRRYEDEIRARGGIDLQLLGIGSDGHIGFNEPSSSLASRTRIKTLTQKTIEANRRFFPAGQEVPRHVLTMGVGTIQDARSILLLAFGDGKADAVAQMVEGPITAMNPASILQMHPRTTVIVDEAAAAKLKHADYYRYVYDNKPAWQRPG